MAGIRGCKSRELRGGVLLTGCDCIRKNGLQDDCRRSQCRGSGCCLTQPTPTCPPGILALKRIRDAPVPRRPPRVNPFEVECKDNKQGASADGTGPSCFTGSNLCPKCGKEMGPCETECPHCSGQGGSKNVEKITSLRAINHCKCGEQIKPGETICKQCAQKAAGCKNGPAGPAHTPNASTPGQKPQPGQNQEPGVLVCFPLTMGEKEINKQVATTKFSK